MLSTISNTKFIHHSLFSTTISVVSFSTSLLFTHTDTHTDTHRHSHTHTHITSHQTNSYMKTLKHENIRIFEKHAHAPGVLLLAL